MTGTLSANLKCTCFKLFSLFIGSTLLSGALTFAQAEDQKATKNDPIPQDEVFVADPNLSKDGPSTYTLRIAKESDRIKLKGNVSTEDEYRMLIGLVKANFPSMDLSDRLKVKPENEVSEVQIGGLSFALKVLGYVENGSLLFDANGLSLEGSVNTAVVLDQVQKLVHKERPEGLSVKKLRVSAPELSWRVQLSANNNIMISGIISGYGKKEEIVRKLNGLFPTYTIIDNSKMTETLPDHWPQAIDKSIELLAYLDHGLVDVTETAINVKGHAADKVKLNLLVEAIEDLPFSVAVNTEVTAPEKISGVREIGGSTTLSATLPAFTPNY